MPADDIRPLDIRCEDDTCLVRHTCATHWRGAVDYYTIYTRPKTNGRDCGMWKPLDSQHGQQPSQASD